MNKIDGLREESKLPFRLHAEFKKADLDGRQDLYRRIAEEVCSPSHLLAEVDR